MSGETIRTIIQLAISLAATGFVVQLLLLRQNRRKIVGEATASEANAASTLSGAALTMVENAQQDAREARAGEKDAHAENEKLRAEHEKLWKERNEDRWRIHALEMRESILEAALEQAGIPVPPRPRYDEKPEGIAPPPTRTQGPAGPGPSHL